MPIEDYEELNLDGMNIDSVRHRFDILEARFPGGYRRSAIVGRASGEQSWAISSECLPDDDTISPIETQARFSYYFDFWFACMQTGNEPFVIEHRGKKYTAVWQSHEYTYEVFTADLYAGSLMVDQVFVEGESYDPDGSISA